MNTIERIAGAAILLVVLADVFLTILYARMHSGFLAMRYVHAIERLWVGASRAFGDARGRLASFCGPVCLLALLGLWTGLLVLGSALVVHPALGYGVRPSNGAASTDFVTALFVGGASVSVVGSSGYSPETPFYRLFFLFDSAVGMTFVSLVLTYLSQVYTALLRRNSLAPKIHGLCEEKGDGAELVCRLWPRGDLSSGTSTLAELGAEMAAVKESHHFYPLLRQFRFEEPYYAVSRMVNVSLDAASLVMSSLDDDHFGAVKESASVALLWRSSLWMVSSLTESSPARDGGATAHDVALWRERHRAALARFRSAGIATVADEARAFERYAELRTRWDGQVRAVAPVLAFSRDEVDPPRTLAERRA